MPTPKAELPKEILQAMQEKGIKQFRVITSGTDIRLKTPSKKFKIKIYEYHQFSKEGKNWYDIFPDYPVCEAVIKIGHAKYRIPANSIEQLVVRIAKILGVAI